MKLLDLLKLIPQPDLDIQVYTHNNVLINTDTLYHIAIEIQHYMYKDKHSLCNIDYTLTYANIEHFTFKNNVLYIMLEDILGVFDL